MKEEEKDMNKKSIVIAISFLLIAALSCTDNLGLSGLPVEATEAPTATPTLAPTAAPTAVPPTLVPTQVPTAAPTLAPTATPIAKPTTTTKLVAGPKLALKGKLFETPVKCTAKFNDESKWIVCEPGVLLNASTAWIIPATDNTYHSNVPEGAFAYYSCGQCTITVDDVSIVNEYKDGRNYLTIVRGHIDDGKIDTDRNVTAKVTSFVPGHMIYSHMPVGAYVSRDWFMQQLQASSQIADATKSHTNCGALGCSETIIKLFDVDTHYYQMFSVKADDLTKWVLVDHN